MQRKMAGLVVLLIVGLVQLGAWKLYRASRQDSAKLDEYASPAERSRVLAAGAPIQRKRIDAFIEQTRSYATFDETADAISQPVDVVFAAGMHPSDSVPSTTYLSVLADRRVAKLFAFLDTIPTDEASRKAVELFDSKLAAHEAGIVKIVADWRDGDGKVEPVPLGANYHALAASLFLCGAFCDGPAVSRKASEWHENIGRQADDVVADPNLEQLEAEIVQYGRPEKLYLFNVYVLVLDRNACLPAEDIEQTIGRRVPRLERIPFSAWDAHTNAFDFTKLHRGVPVDDSKTLGTFSVARSWDGELYFDESGQKGILEELQLLTETCRRP